MEHREQPSIKGIFVKSHVRLVEEQKGSNGVHQLERCFGKPVQFSNAEDISLHDEVHLLRCALAIIEGKDNAEAVSEYDTGRLHFRSFATTPLAKIILSTFRTNFKRILLHSKNLASHILHGVSFSPEDYGPKGVKITVSDNEYPIEHFRGFFAMWLEYAGLRGTVEAQRISDNMYEYIIRWE